MKLSWIFASIAILILFRETNASRSLPQSSKDEKEYDVKKIPGVLLKDADAVIRTNRTQFEVKNERSAKLLVKYAVTIFKKEKRDYGEFVLWYDKFHEIEEFEGNIYNANGEKIRELESGDIKEYSGTDGISLVIDARARVAELYHDQYPYTIEFTYEYSYNGYLNWPMWLSQGSLDPVEHNRFEISIPTEDSLRIWCNKDTIQPTISIEANKKIYVWESKNLPKLSKDVVGEDMEDVATIVRVAPSLFEIDDYPGDMRTWKKFGKWDYSLIKDRDILPEPAVRDIHSLLLPTDDTKTKIKKLYRYMQDRTRYVSIQLGIGGWQPFEAKQVHERGYGDCKALSNYMVALLKAAGIVAYPFLIRAGNYRLSFISEFPSNQFNHEMVCVPLQNDTVWLECTSQSMPFGHISSQTENRGVLLITPEGGVVVRTPPSTSQQNRQQRQGSVTLTFIGDADADVTITRTGNQQDYVRHAIGEAPPIERERWVMNHLGIPSANLKSFTFSGLETHDLKIDLSLQLALPRFASYSSDRIFFQPNLMERRTSVPPDIAQRLSPIRYDYPYLDIDSISYSLPTGFTTETLPKEVHLTSSFGEFKSKTVAIGDSAIVYERSLEIREYSIPAKKYIEYRTFFADIVKADKAQVVLVRKDSR
jgi:hypothetical protein